MKHTISSALMMLIVFAAVAQRAQVESMQVGTNQQLSSSKTSAVMDTLTNIEAGDSATLYGISGGWGFVSGHNNYGDLSKAEYFSDFDMSGTVTLLGGIFFFGYVTDGGNGTMYDINVWDNTGASGSPGNIIGSQSVSLAAIEQSYLDTMLFMTLFAPGINITSPFYLGISFNYVAGDTIGIVTNTDGQTSPATGWEEWSNNVWYAYDDASSFGIGIAHYIWAIVDIQSTIGIEESAFTQNGLTLFGNFPNPAQDVTTIAFATDEHSEVTIELYDMSARKLNSFELGNLSSGRHEFNLAVSDLAQGEYLYAVRTEKSTVFAKLNLVR
jgi:hypothetical protein